MPQNLDSALLWTMSDGSVLFPHTLGDKHTLIHHGGNDAGKKWLPSRKLPEETLAFESTDGLWGLDELVTEPQWWLKEGNWGHIRRSTFLSTGNQDLSLSICEMGSYLCSTGKVQSIQLLSVSGCAEAALSTLEPLPGILRGTSSLRTHTVLWAAAHYPPLQKKKLRHEDEFTKISKKTTKWR